jgi:DNA topoisomerase VI subunit A
MHIDNKRNKTKNSESILLVVFVYAKFGIAIFMTFRLSNIANAIEANENATADINIILNEVADGK